MPVFQVSSRIVQASHQPAKRVSLARRRSYAVLRYVEGIVMVAGVFAIAVVILRAQWVWFLLPAGVSVVVTAVTARERSYHLRALLLTTGMAFLYFGGIIAFELVTEAPRTAEVIVAATTLTAAVIFAPLRTFVQRFLEQRFHLRDDETTRMVEAFTTSLREEIDLSQVRERFLDVVQTMLQPRSVSFWVRTSAQDDAAAGGEPVTIADTDPLMAYALSRPDVMEVDRLQLDSPTVRSWQADGVELALPLASEGELLGLLLLGPRLNPPAATLSWVWNVIAVLTVSGPFRLLVLGLRPPTGEYVREDRALLATLAAEVAPALRVAQLVRAQQAQAVERARVEQELQTAQRIQRTFLPQDVPAAPGWQLIPSYQPAREVSGDFYDFLPMEDGCLGVVIGDVTGKGVPAALVMVATRTILRTAAQENAAPGAVLARVNAMLCADVPPGMFATCFYALLDLGSGRIHYANAGHDLPYLRRANGSVEDLCATGMPLGLMPDTQYEESETTLEPGGTLLFYTDGLVEAHNPEREMFGLPRLRALVSEHGSGAALIDALHHELRDFTGMGWEQEDDVTLVTVHRAAGEGDELALAAQASIADPA
jgi:serine phosphatase RsbU (regulator of sigma subunit)